MSEILEKILRNKKFLLSILIAAAFLFFLSARPTDALVEAFASSTGCGGGLTSIGCWLGKIFDFLIMIPMYMFLGPILGVMAVISIIGIFLAFVFYAFACLILNWVVSEHFVALSLTQTTNPIIDAGFHFTSGLVNLIFVLILVFIAFSTILRLESFGMKKLLPKFIIAVILVNFSLVIMGGIVDIANVVQMSFLGNIGDIGGTFLNTFLTSVPVIGDFYSKMSDAPNVMGFLNALDSVAESFLSLSGFVQMLVKVISAIAFGFFGGFVILLYALLFMVRILAMWFLAILAPIAWVCWILPQTQKIWKMWWNYFIQWAFVGAIAGFFLRLSETVIHNLNNLAPALTVPVGGNWGHAVLSIISEPITTAISGIFALGAVIAFMLIGFMISIKFAGGGTEMVLNWGAKIGKTAGLMGGLAAARWAGKKYGPGIQKAGKDLKEKGIQMPEGKLKKVLAYPFAKPAEILSKSRIGGWAARTIGTGLEMAGSEITTRAKASEASDIEKNSENLLKTAGTKEAKANAFRRAAALGPAGDIGKSAAIYALMKDGQLDEAINAGLLVDNDETGEKSMAVARKYAKQMWDRDIKAPARWMADEGMAQMIYPEDWQKGAELIKQGETARAEGYKRRDLNMRNMGLDFIADGEDAHNDAMKKLLGRVKTSDVQHMTEGSLRDKTVRRAIIETFDGAKMAEIGRNFGRDIVSGIQEDISKIPFKELAKKNPNLTLWLYGNTATDLGFTAPKSMGKKEALNEVRRVRASVETDRKTQKDYFKKAYAGREQMMFRDYFRKDTPDTDKGLIREVIAEAGKAIPTEAGIQKRIGNYEKQHDELEKDLRRLRTTTELAEKRFKELSAIGGANLVAARRDLDEARKQFSAGRDTIYKAQDDLLDKEKTELKDLW